MQIAAKAKTLDADIAHGERKGLESLLSIPLGLAGNIYLDKLDQGSGVLLGYISSCLVDKTKPLSVGTKLL